MIKLALDLQYSLHVIEAGRGLSEIEFDLPFSRPPLLPVYACFIIPLLFLLASIFNIWKSTQRTCPELLYQSLTHQISGLHVHLHFFPAKSCLDKGKIKMWYCFFVYCVSIKCIVDESFFCMYYPRKGPFVHLATCKGILGPSFSTSLMLTDSIDCEK